MCSSVVWIHWQSKAQSPKTGWNGLIQNGNKQLKQQFVAFLPTKMQKQFAGFYCLFFPGSKRSFSKNPEENGNVHTFSIFFPSRTTCFRPVWAIFGHDRITYGGNQDCNGEIQTEATLGDFQLLGRSDQVMVKLQSSAWNEWCMGLICINLLVLVWVAIIVYYCYWLFTWDVLYIYMCVWLLIIPSRNQYSTLFMCVYSAQILAWTCVD